MLRTAISGINEKDVALNKLEREREREVWHVEAVKALKDVGGKRERAREVSGKGRELQGPPIYLKVVDMDPMTPCELLSPSLISL